VNGWHRKGDPAALAARRKQYNSREHKARRAAGQRQVDAGVAYCWRCGAWLPPGQVWHLGHDDEDRTVYRGPECPPCNLKAAARKGARIAHARRRGGAAPRAWQSRAW
jgi:hypothetical protein